MSTKASGPGGDLGGGGGGRRRHGKNSMMWLDAFSDTQATIYTFPNCVATADLAGDGDYRLIIADLGTGHVPSKLKIYRGTGLQAEVNLQEMPTAVAPIFIDNESPRLPVITVASSEYIYVYKNLRPFFRAVLPTLPVNPVERDVWGQFENVDSLSELLRNLQMEVGISALSLKSQNFLSLPAHERSSFVESQKLSPLQRKNIVTCISTLKKSYNDEDALACLVIGTENCEILVLHPETFTPIEEAKLNLTDVPVFLSTSGLFDIDYTLTCTTRTGQLLIGRRGYVAPLLKLVKPPVGVLCLDSLVVVALMDSSLSCYNDKMHRLWQVQAPSFITCISKMQLKQKNLEMIAVGTQKGQIILYTILGEIVDKVEFPESISAIFYGQYGRESNSLITITKGGSLHVKILKRTADFTPQLSGEAVSSLGKLQIPKKTKLFVDQTMRERDNSIAMHRAFQRDCFKAKLETARNLVKVIETKQTPTSISDSVKLSAEVLGLGSSFLIRIGIQNIGSTATTDLGLFLHWDDKYYNISPAFINVPLLVPGPEIVFQTRVECITPTGIADAIRVIVLRKKLAQPILVAIINMPPSEMPAF